MLGEVVVKADLPATRLTGNVMVTTVAGSVLSKAGTANDVLAKIPLVTGGDGNFKVFGRGAPVIYINGRKVTDASSLEQLSSEDIKSVEVISNPGPQYPADVNAVIRIKTLPPKGEGFSLSAYSNTMLATFARNSENLDLKYRVGGLEVFANGYFYGGKWSFTISVRSPLMARRFSTSRWKPTPRRFRATCMGNWASITRLARTTRLARITRQGNPGFRSRARLTLE